MPSYRVIVSEKAEKAIKNMQKPLQERIREKIYGLEADPFSGTELKGNLKWCPQDYGWQISYPV